MVGGREARYDCVLTKAGLGNTHYKDMGTPCGADLAYDWTYGVEGIGSACG